MTKTNQSLYLRRQNTIPKGVFNVGQVFAESARGAVITDVEGKQYIDFAGGIGVQNVGHCHPKVVKAIQDKAEKLTHSCFHITMYEEYVELCEKLCGLVPGDFAKMAALFNSGAEAVENAVKACRHHSGRQGVIAFEAGFHGRTLLCMSLTSKVKPYKFGFGPFAPEVYRMPYAYCYRCPLGENYPDCGVACADLLQDFFVEHVAAENVACLIIEPILGEGGFVTPPPEYFPKLKAICEEHGIAFIADEIQTGFGRTGTMLAMEHWGVTPDLTTVAKSMGGGMPVSGVAGRRDILDAPQVGGMGGTYGGNPVACAAALAVMDVIESENLLMKSKKLGETVRSRFVDLMSEYELIGDVRGKGPMLALELVTDRETKAPAAAQAQKIAAKCMEKGLIVLSCGTYGNVIRTLMPLVIEDEQLDKGMAILEETFAEITG